MMKNENIENFYDFTNNNVKKLFRYIFYNFKLYFFLPKFKKTKFCKIY